MIDVYTNLGIRAVETKRDNKKEIAPGRREQ
jgi:hypothetical protein